MMVHRVSGSTAITAVTDTTAATDLLVARVIPEDTLDPGEQLDMMVVVASEQLAITDQ